MSAIVMIGLTVMTAGCDSLFDSGEVKPVCEEDILGDCDWTDHCLMALSATIVCKHGDSEDEVNFEFNACMSVRPAKVKPAEESLACFYDCAFEAIEPVYDGDMEKCPSAMAIWTCDDPACAEQCDLTCAEVAEMQKAAQ